MPDKDAHKANAREVAEHPDFYGEARAPAMDAVYQAREAMPQEVEAICTHCGYAEGEHGAGSWACPTNLPNQSLCFSTTATFKATISTP